MHPAGKNRNPERISAKINKFLLMTTNLDIKDSIRQGRQTKTPVTATSILC